MAPDTTNDNACVVCLFLNVARILHNGRSSLGDPLFFYIVSRLRVRRARFEVDRLRSHQRKMSLLGRIRRSSVRPVC